MRTLCFFIEPLFYDRRLVQLDKAATFTGWGGPVTLAVVAAVAVLVMVVMGEFPDCIRVTKMYLG